MIAAIYARKSNDQTDVADEEKSVTRQVERARQYAERKGWTVDPAAIFVDDGVSGADFVRREGFLRLMNALKPRAPFQVLVMMEQSRLGRSLAEVPYAIRQISRAGVRIHCYLTDSEIKSETTVDRFQSSVMAFVDEMHREQSRQRTRDALRRHAERGYVAGGLVFGYRNREVRVGDKRSHVLREIDADQAEVVRRIFRDIARGDGFCRIAKRLNVEGVPSPRPKKHGWAVSGVREIALRDLYRGLVIYGKTRWEDRDREDHHGQASAKRKVPCPPSEWITTEEPRLRIIDEPLWAAAQARLGATRATYARLTDGRLVGRPAADRGPGHLLTGFLRCAACEGPVFCQKHTTRKGGTRLYYVCATQRTRGTCPRGGLRIDREALDAAVLDAIESAVLSPDRLVELVDRILARAARGPAPAERRMTLERQLHEARARIERYVRALGDGLDVEEVRTELIASKAKAHALEVELAGLGATAAPVIDRALVARRVADWRGILRRGPVLARQILRKVFPGVRPLALAPAEGGGVAFTGYAAGASILAGLANVTMMVPPEGTARHHTRVLRGLLPAA